MDRAPITWSAGLYMLLLLGIVVYGSLAFGELGRLSPPQAMDAESMRLFAPYGRFLRYSSVALAMCLSAFAAIVGVTIRSLFPSLSVLLIGVLVTTVGYSFLPRYHFPGDEYTAWFVWLTTAIYPLLGAWLLTYFLGRIVVRHKADQS